MKNIQAELEQWDYDAPTVWEPAPGDILIGTVKGPCSSHPINTLQSLIVQEQETGLEVAVTLESAELANLVKLQHPASGERIGIRCVKCEDGERHYILMVDRSQPTECLDNPQDSAEQDRLPERSDEFIGATEQERFFIENALSDDDLTADSKLNGHSESSAALTEIIKRQQEHITKQSESIRELAQTLAASLDHLNRTSQIDQERLEDQKEARKEGIGPLMMTLAFVSSFSVVLAGFLLYIVLR